MAIEKNDTRYFVKDKYMDASPATGDFESMLSVLVSREEKLQSTHTHTDTQLHTLMQCMM